MTADQRKELEALEAEIRNLGFALTYKIATRWADRIAAVLANGGEEG
jgi:hypothetical protein